MGLNRLDSFTSAAPNDFDFGFGNEDPFTKKN